MRVTELYKITGAPEEYHWTNSDIDVEYNGDTYIPEVVMRSEIAQTEEINRSDLRLTIAPDNELARIFYDYPPEYVITVTVFRKEEDADNSCFLTYWKGRVISTSSSDWECSVQCESVFTGLRRTGVRARYQRQCRHALYGRGCNVDKSSYATATTCSSVSDRTVTVSGSLEAGSYLGGIAECNGISRFIVGQSGGVLTLWRPFPFIEVGDTVTVYPGCDRSLNTCASKFNNAENHGGFPWLPTVNPFKFVSLW